MRAPQPVADDTDVATSPEPATEIIADRERPTRVRRHPSWCDRRRCVTGESAARHASTPTRLNTGEQTFALTLIQHDPEGDPELLIEVTDTTERDGPHVLTLPEIKALAETLLIEYLKAASLVPAPRNPGTTTAGASAACHAP
ncbi:MAG: hypothetical protein ACRDRS_04355 [Pseudonocardiaceae bacterium]